MSKQAKGPYKIQVSEKILCDKCGVYLVPGKVTLAYLGTTFPVDLPKCPQCGLVYIPEELARGKMRQAEEGLEDK